MRAIISIVSLLGIALLGSGCMGQSGTVSSQPPSVSYEVQRGTMAIDQRRLEDLDQVASRQMACPAAALDARPVAGRVWQVSGCGTTREYALMERGWSARWEPLMPLPARASNELSCPSQSLVVSAARPSVRNVSGCGREATYELACSTRECQWVMTGAQGQPPGAQQPYPATQPYPPSQQQPYPATQPYPPSQQQPYPQQQPQPYPQQQPGGYAPPGVIVSPPSGAVIVTPPGQQPQAVDPGIDSALRDTLDRQRSAILSCAPGAREIAVRARWGPDGTVIVSTNQDPAFAGTPLDQCIRRSLGTMRVTTGQPGEIVHIVR